MLNTSLLMTVSLLDDPNAQRLVLIRFIESLLSLPLAQANEQCLAAAPDDTAARKLNEMLVLVRSTLYRDLGITPTGGEAQFKKLNDEYAANTLPPGQRTAYDKLTVASAIGAALLQKFPGITGPVPPAPDEVSARAQLDALYQRQLEAQKYTVPPLITEERLDTLAELVADYRTLLKSVTPGRPVYTDINFFAGHATYALARGWQQLGLSDRAARCYADAVPLFKRGERPKDAEEAAKLARSLGFAAHADFDGASAEALRTLIDGRPDAYTRARAYASLASLAYKANSVFDALQDADQAAAELASLGYADVESADFDASFQRWIDACCAKDAAPPDLKPAERINEIARLYLGLLSIRFAYRTSQSLATATSAEAATERLSAAMQDINRQIEQAHRTVMTELTRYRP